MQAQHPRSVLLLAISVSFALLSLQGCSNGQSDVASDPAPVAAESVDVGRFEVRTISVKRGPGMLLRTDTATGQAWTMGVMEAPKWQPLREGAAGVPSPDGTASGRYAIRAVKQTRGAPTLVRTDQATGRVWRKGATSKGPWVAIPNPDPSALTEPEPEPASNPAAMEEPRADAPDGSDGDSDADADPAEEAATQ